MIKRFILTVALVMAFALPASAASNVNGIYLGAKFIDSIQTREGSGDLSGTFSQNTVGGGVFVGYDFYPQFNFPMRAELEYAIRSNMTDSYSLYGGSDYAKADATWGLQTLFANVYFDFHNSSAFTPYIGAGVGMGFVNTEFSGSSNIKGVYGNYSRSESSTVFAWNVGAGCSYAFNENVSADLAYRFVGLGESEMKYQGAQLNTYGNAHEFSLGLRLTF